MNYINLWSALVELEYLGRRHPNISLHPEVSGDDLQALSRVTRLGLQEFSIEATDEGWLIKVFGGEGDGEIEILIPKDSRNPVKVLKDRAYKIMHLHD